MTEKADTLVILNGVLDGLGALVDELRAPLKELQEMSVESSGDPAHLSRGLTKARGLTERASHLEANAIAILARVRAGAKLAHDSYQDRYDAAVYANRNRWRDSSWEERASMFRTSVMDELVVLRKIERHAAGCEALMEQIQVFCRSVYRARNDLSTQLDAIRASARAAGDA